MPKTMNKDDVQYRAKLSTFDQSKIQELTGKSPNSAVAAAIREVKKKQKSGELKAPELKIGLIGSHLFLRIKDGKTHIDDFLLKKNWTPPGEGDDEDEADDGPVRDGAYRRKVANYIEIRTAARDQIFRGEKALKAMHGELEDMLERTQALVTEAKGAFGFNNPRDRAAELVREAIEKTREAERFFQAEVHTPFADHRNFKKPDGVATEDVDAYGRTFYLSEMRPKYAKAKEYVKLCTTTTNQIRAAAKNVRNFADHGEDQLANYRSMAGELVTLAQAQAKAATEVWGLQPVEGVARAVTEDQGKLVGLRTQGLAEKDLSALSTRYLQTSNERIVMMKAGYSALKKNLVKMNQIVDRAKAIPKPMLKDGQVKTAMKELAAAQKGLKSYIGDCEGHIKKAADAWSKMKKEAANVA